MTGILKYIFNISLSQGPSESINEEMELNTYDVVTIELKDGEEKAIVLLPDSNPRLKFICITSDKYSTKDDPNEAELLYKIRSNATTPQDIPIVLDRPHVMIGKSVIDKIGNFSKLTIKYNGDPESKANVRIIVGRDV